MSRIKKFIVDSEIFSWDDRSQENRWTVGRRIAPVVLWFVLLLSVPLVSPSSALAASLAAPLLQSPGIEIEKATNALGESAQDADTTPGPYISAGTEVVWTYVVSNTGTAPLASINIVDDQEGLITNLLSGDINNNNVLDVDETWLLFKEGIAQTGQYINHVHVESIAVDGAGSPLLDGTGQPLPPITDDDLSHYFGAEPSLTFQTAINGYRPITPPGPYLTMGEVVTWTYTITNSGNVPFNQVDVSGHFTGNPTSDPFGNMIPVVLGDNDNDAILDVDETWTYVLNRTIGYDQYIATTSLFAKPVDNLGNPIPSLGYQILTADDVLYYVGTRPSLQLAMRPNRQNADTIPGPTILADEAIVWTYVVANNGTAPLANITLTDDALGAVGYQTGGDSNGNGLLDIGEFWTYEIGDSATTGQQTLTAQVSAQPVKPNGDPLIGLDGLPMPSTAATTTAFYYGATVALEFDKQVDSQYANATGNDPVILADTTFEWTYVLTNSGNIPLENILLTDDSLFNNGPTNSVNVTTLSISGDSNNNGRLDPSEVWIWTQEGSAKPNQQTRLATITASPISMNSRPVLLADNSEAAPVSIEKSNLYFGAAPALEMVKTTNGILADTAPGLYLPTGHNLSWHYTLTNSGNVDLSITNFSNSTAGTIGPPTSGDQNNNGLLDVGETWHYEMTDIASSGPIASLSTLTAQPLDSMGNPILPTSSAISQSQTQYYFGVDTQIVIESQVNGVDADNGQGLIIKAGETLRWAYRIYNNSNVTLIEIDVTDSGLAGAVNSSTLFCPQTTLLAGEQMECTAETTAMAGAQEHLATVSAIPADGQNNSLVEIEPDSFFAHQASDPTRYFGANIAIDLEKATNGVDADSPSGPYIAVNSTIAWTYRVVNPGNWALTDVVLTDQIDNETQITPEPLLDGGYNVGDLNQDGLLDAGETWLYDATGTAQLGSQASTATVIAKPLASGRSFPQTVTDSDMSHYLGSQTGIEVQKYTNGQDSDEAPGVYVSTGDTVLWTYEVYNRGNSSVTNIVLTDVLLQEGQETPIETSPVLGDESTFNIGDSNLNRRLDNDEVWRYTAEGIPAQSGPYETMATVTGIPIDGSGNPLNGEPLQASDPSHYFGATPALTLRYFAGDTEDTEPYLVTESETVIYTFIVENHGNIALKNLAITDDNGTPDDPNDDLLLNSAQCGVLAGPLAPDNRVQCQLQKQIDSMIPTQVARATVKGTPVDQENRALAHILRPAAQASAAVALMAPALAVEYTLHPGYDGANCPGAPELFSPEIDRITHCYQATNQGNTYLDQVRLLDDQGMLLGSYDQLLAPNQSLDFFIEERIDLAGSNQIISKTVKAVGIPSRSNGVYIGNGPLTATDTVAIYQEAVHVGGIVWYDDDGNGLQNELVADTPSNGGVQGVTAYLIDGLTGDPILDVVGQPVQQVTDANGHYLFDELSPGNYVVRFDLTTLPAGYKPTLSYQEDVNSQSLVESETGYASTTGILFGGEENLSIHLGLIKGVEIGGLIWVDKNQDGVQGDSAEEPGIAKIELTLLDKTTGLPILNEMGAALTAKTDSTGRYLFKALPTGNYAVRLNAESIPRDYLHGSLERASANQLSGSQAELELNFGLIETVALSGIVWYDNNSDGIQDEITQEQGVLDVLVTLLNGETGTAVLGEDGKPLSTRTDIDGLYRFAYLSPGSYTIWFDLETLPFGYMPTLPDVNLGNGVSDESDSDVEPFTGKTPAILLPNNGASTIALDLGITRDAPVQVGGQIWFDPDRDGQRVPLSADEQAQTPTVADITVVLLDSETMQPVLDEHGLWQTQQTDEEGIYLFTGLPAGNYAAQFILGQLPAGYAPTVQNQGNNRSDSDVDPETGYTTSTGPIPSGEQHLTLDLGIVSVQPEDESNNDTGNNGGSENNHDNGNSSDIGDTENGGSDNSGNDGSGNSDSENDSTENPNDGTDEDSQGDVLDDAVVSRPATIGDTVWYDLDRDGILDEDESGIEDFTIHLYNEDGALVRTTKTGAGGFYLFTGVTPGTYQLQCVRQLGYQISPQNVGGDATRDSDIDPTDCRTPWITLDSGAYETGWDMGMYTLERSGVIRNQVWFDTNQNGRLDRNESGISGILVDLYNIRNELLWTQRTNANGEYRFYDLEYGTYYLEFMAAPEYTMAEASSSNRGRKIRTPLISLNEEVKEVTGSTIGYHLNGLEPVSLGSQVWHDLNKDGIKDSDEPGLSGVLVRLYDANERVSATAITDQDGNYLFQGLVPKQYTLEFVPPAGFEFHSIDSSVGRPVLDTDDFALRSTEITLDNESDLVMLVAGFTSSPTALPISSEVGLIEELFLPIIYKP